ncbi:MAG: hypothetical protein ABW185_13445, partial [Sedimenticola sp.]
MGNTIFNMRCSQAYYIVKSQPQTPHSGSIDSGDIYQSDDADRICEQHSTFSKLRNLKAISS